MKMDNTPIQSLRAQTLRWIRSKSIIPASLVFCWFTDDDAGTQAITQRDDCSMSADARNKDSTVSGDCIVLPSPHSFPEIRSTSTIRLRPDDEYVSMQPISPEPFSCNRTAPLEMPIPVYGSARSTHRKVASVHERAEISGPA